ncbi:hypothetical protein PFISCL1PPCAC_12690, partial [Pristionchus fissidentatus]
DSKIVELLDRGARADEIFRSDLLLLRVGHCLDGGDGLQDHSVASDYLMVDLSIVFFLHYLLDFLCTITLFFYRHGSSRPMDDCEQKNAAHEQHEQTVHY